MSKTLDLSPFHKKTLSYYHAGTTVTLQTSQSLFSSHQIDVGTMHLIKSLDTSKAGGRILDIGCGYGPLGIWAGKALQASDVHMTDRDALAVAFAAHNAQINAVPGAAFGSLAYDQVPDQHYNLILSNIPGKAGDAAIRSMLLDAEAFLAQDGSAAIVIVTPLEPLVLDTLAQPAIEITYHEQFSGHTVIHYHFTGETATRPAETGIQRKLYDRGEMDLSFDAFDMHLRTARGLAEFESLSFDTQLMLKVIDTRDVSSLKNVHCVNAGQGILPVYLSLLGDGHITLHDRDLLALGYTQQNLIDNGCAQERIIAHHQAFYHAEENQSADLIVFKLRDDESADIHQVHIETALNSLAPHGQLIISGGSTPITRLSKWLEGQKLGRISQRKRNKGWSVIVVQQRH